MWSDPLGPFWMWIVEQAQALLGPWMAALVWNIALWLVRVAYVAFAAGGLYWSTLLWQRRKKADRERIADGRNGLMEIASTTRVALAMDAVVISIIAALIGLVMIMMPMPVRPSVGASFALVPILIACLLRMIYHMLEEKERGDELMERHIRRHAPDLFGKEGA